MLQTRADYKRNRQASQASINGATYYTPQPGAVYMPMPLPPNPSLPPPPLPQDHRSVISDVFYVTAQQSGYGMGDRNEQSGYGMGDRNEQAALRSRNTNGGDRDISVTRTVRKATTNRTIESVDYEPKPNTKAANESDTNADTCCLETNFISIANTNRTADVYPYDKSYSLIQDVPIVSSATAYDDVESRKTYILVFHEALYYGTKLPHSY